MRHGNVTPMPVSVCVLVSRNSVDQKVFRHQDIKGFYSGGLYYYYYYCVLHFIIIIILYICYRVLQG